MKKGFTLVEILVAVMIVTLLVTMAVPMYDKTVEKSRMAEARTLMKKMLESKLRTLDNMDRENYSSGLFGFEHLDISVPCVNSATGASIARCTGATIYTKDFKYTLLPTGSVSGSSAAVANGVCAVRRKGDNKGTAFLYLGELETDPDREKFLCSGSMCEAYGMDSTGTAWCSL
ncbi:type IV pilin protein [Candidatus Avelusimicrobium alvi]|uniref:type IV pilin protein n=1 Tax=Candidatus Avelusimicrobium alvi TaxID=3416221 RepID=UPI003D13A463